MKDYLIKFTVKNNLLMSAIKEAGFSTIAEFSRATGVGQQTIGGYVNLKVIPYNEKTGLFKESILKISKTLKMLPEDLFPPQHLKKALTKNTVTTEMSLPDVENLLTHEDNAQKRIEFKERKSKIAIVLATLTEREKQIIEYRFGFVGPKKTLKECGVIFSISDNRVRQIEAKALRKMRHPTRSKIIEEYVDV